MTIVRGVSSAIAKLRQKRKAYAKGAEAGVKLAALFLLRKSKEIVPVDTGTLKGSGYVRGMGKGYDFIAIVGYTAEYAIYVHEDLEARHSPGKQAKYLEAPARRYRAEMQRIIKSAMAVAK